MKKLSKIALCAALALGLAACTIDKPTTLPANTGNDVEEPMFEIPSSFEAVAFDEAQDHWNDEDTIMVYSFSDCPHCAVVVPLLGEIEQEVQSGIRYIYVDVERSERENGNDTYDKTIEHFSEWLGEEQKMYVPFTVYIHDGEVVMAHIGDEGVDGMDIKETLKSYLNMLENA